ncbi:36.4 kDa proline-rich protein-like [Lactuca sativa]|uniref:36.4 kDa proline-rich protein-like n=1 Tax=Lactuca sativa TaxID=4236 RepID=UPI000CD9EDE0|nr:36.4 kDa proline-rich protein-like [Lactuca sativa]
MARKSHSPTPPHPGNDDDVVDDCHQESPRGNTPPRSPTPTESPSHKHPTPPPSPEPKVTVSVVLTSNSISIPPVTYVSIPLTTFTTTPPVSSTPVFSTPISIIPLPPIINQTPTPTLLEPTVVVNVSDTGATTDTQPPIITKPLSPPNSTGSDATIGGDNDEYDFTYFSPYRLQSDEGNDAPVNRQHLQGIHEKLDQ